ncbi:hypothetical protein Q2T41_18035 [Maribacter confluentis]|uniref:Uncharacterized protein n=1 Tax=Maribacter confluentis TaxID=1656093 RepID=A0ABT8RV93_9FLAO|nr:hypothetical protein [Maribacter confluentis]MDO1514558.1 hypothetical protein [Maribacter confluentis]
MKKILLSILAIFGITVGGKAQTEELQTGLINTLTITANRFEKSNNAFLINIIKDNVVILQIVHGGLIEQARTEENTFNFSFNVTFDNEKDNQNRFTALKISKDFKYYEWDGIPCYALNVGNDKNKAEEIAIKILTKVYGFDSKDLFEFEIYDQGRM